MPKNEFKDFATFETLITPKIITVVYWLVTVLLILGSILSWLRQSEGMSIREGANKRGNSSRLTQSFHFFMFEPIFSPVNALNQPI